ncbi:hypothetical protein RISK_004555 [Rhodopirellula islandica]|uniref:Thioredoxin domain-containing protein n=1 Tax=Rhodopirellula islandica TaxID=595434 RepID=A0A0J1B9M0_RHOIS|nr:thioredoxin family protein [Rhodopirellula islandica]KLU03243.1 hypothetical protein RISK_004555 [Rhodopirellula islandica]
MVPDQIQGTAVGSFHDRLSGLKLANVVCMLLVGMLSPFVSNPGLAQDTSHTGVLKGLDLDGRLIRLGQSNDTNAVAVVFLSTHCPISNGYLPLLNDYASEYGGQGIELVGVISDPSVTRSDAKKHSVDYRVEFPVLFDGSGELRLALSPTHTPQAMLIRPNGKMLYNGAIDDRHVQVGRKKDHAAKPYLRDAIRAVIARRPVDVPKTKPIGCLLEDPPNKAIEGEVTYARDVAPVIQANCAGCHCRNGSAPFPLLSYNDVSGHANQILEVTHSRFMPPWKPAAGFLRFQDELRLTNHEMSLLNVWVRDGKPAGDPKDLPAPVPPSSGWPLGEPDLILEMNETFSIPSSGPDLRQYFVIPTGLKQHRLVNAIDFHPGTPQSVHHASFFLDTKRKGRRLDQSDPAPGYSSFGGPRFEPEGTLSSWFPGMSPRRLPEGMGRFVPKDSDIVAEIHYVTTGKPHQDKSKIGIYFAPSSAKKIVTEVQVGNKRIRIPPGESHHLQRATYTLPVDTVLLDTVPHMHIFGREMKVWSKSPDGETKPLLWIKDWDFNWQGKYSFAEPVRLKKGTILHVDAWYDNSANNPLNPNSPPKPVSWGADSTDEMLICHFQCTCETMGELNELIRHQKKHIADRQ